MCNDWCIQFIEENLLPLSPDATVLEVGSRDVNGSVRSRIEPQVASYTGVDLQEGPGVDRVLNAELVREHFADELFDAIVATETIEHVHNWPAVLSGMMALLKPGGVLAITTRSPGFELHGFPDDHWRYTRETFEQIAQGMAQILLIQDDLTYGYPSGVGVIVRKTAEGCPDEWIQRLRQDILVFHIATGSELSFSDYQTLQSVLRSEGRDPWWNPLLTATLVVQSSSEWMSLHQRPQDGRVLLMCCGEGTGSALRMAQSVYQANRSPLIWPEATGTWLASFPAELNHERTRLTNALALQSNIRGVLQGDSPLVVSPLCAGQSRVLDQPAEWVVLNPTDERFSLSVEMRQCEITLPMLLWNGAEVAPETTGSFSYQVECRWLPVLCPPGEHRLSIVPENERLSFTRLTCSVVSDDQKRLGRAIDTAIQAIRSRTQSFHDEAERYRQALDHREARIRKLEAHAANQQILLDEATRDLSNHKVLLQEARKHIENLEALLPAEEKNRPS